MVTSYAFKGFTKDGVTGFAGAGDNNVGAQVIKSTDSGKTWAAAPEMPRDSFNIYLDATAASATSAVVAGVIAQEHTIDGNTFFEGGPFLCPAQDMGILPDSGSFALIGQCAKGNGVRPSHTRSVATRNMDGPHCCNHPSHPPTAMQVRHRPLRTRRFMLTVRNGVR